MGVQDLIITPIYLLILYIIAYAIRSKVTDINTRKYFIPALSVKFLGAISFGLIYQFYYDGGGDTFGYWKHGSNHIFDAFWFSPAIGIKMLFNNGTHYGDIFQFSSKIWYFRDSASYNIVKIGGIFDLLSFKTYSTTAILFASLSFSGIWALYYTFYRLLPKQKTKLAYVVLFIPTVVFWDSGIIKDSVTLGALGWATFALYNVFWFRRKLLINILLLLMSTWIIFSIKKYILISFLVAGVVWIYSIYIFKIKQPVIRTLVAPFLVVIMIGFGYLLVDAITHSDSKYALDQIARTAQITAYDIRYGWGKDGGSGYSLGQLDGSFGSMLALAPSAIGTSLFRPFIWEAANPLMLFAALEALVLLSVTLYFIISTPNEFFRKFKNPHLRFVMVFAIIFAFAVGVSTYNFGTLSRYKIPMLPFYGIGLVIINSKYGKTT